MISVITEDEAVWFSFLTLNCVLAFVSAAVQPAWAGLHLVCLHRPLRLTRSHVCAEGAEESVVLTRMDSESCGMA